MLSLKKDYHYNSFVKKVIGIVTCEKKYLSWFCGDRTTILVRALYRRDHRAVGGNDDIMLAPRAKGLWFDPRWTILNIF